MENLYSTFGGEFSNGRNLLWGFTSLYGYQSLFSLKSPDSHFKAYWSCFGSENVI